MRNMDLAFPNFNTGNLDQVSQALKAFFGQSYHTKLVCLPIIQQQFVLLKILDISVLQHQNNSLRILYFVDPFYKVWQAISSRINLSKYLL